MRRTLVGAVGVVATALLHSLLFAVAIWGVDFQKLVRAPDAVGAGANSGRRDGESGERLMIIGLATDISEVPSAAALAPRLAERNPDLVMLEIRGPDALPMPPLKFDIEGESTEATDAEMMARTKMAGMYESQIRARIERAWTKPSETLAVSKFNCRLKISQARDGSIGEVELESCNGPPAWQQSLVSAVFSASPLPAPPDPSVFVDSFSLAFKVESMQAVIQSPAQ